jgi:hypothetical protein
MAIVFPKEEYTLSGCAISVDGEQEAMIKKGFLILRTSMIDLAAKSLFQ